MESLSVFLIWLFLHDQIQVKHFGGEDLTWGEHNIGNAMFSHCIPSGSKHIVSGGSTSGSAEFGHLIGGCIPVSPLCRYMCLLSLISNL